jgi:hypothetical protein
VKPIPTTAIAATPSERRREKPEFIIWRRYQGEGMKTQFSGTQLSGTFGDTPKMRVSTRPAGVMSVSGVNPGGVGVVVVIGLLLSVFVGTRKVASQTTPASQADWSTPMNVAARTRQGQCKPSMRPIAPGCP